MFQLGNRTEDSIIDFFWPSNGQDGASITRATNGTISVYKANGDTQSTAGVTDTEDADTTTGLHRVRIDTSADAFYAVGNDYTAVLTGAVIDGKTVNVPLAHFTLEYGFNEVDVVKWLGTAAATPTVAGVPEVDVTYAGGSVLTGSGGTPDVNVTQLGGSAAALANLLAAYLNGLPFLVGQVHNGIASTTTSFETDTAALTSQADDFFNNATITFVSGALQGITCRVSDYVAATNVFTVSTLPAAPANDVWFILIGRQTG